jgi:D-beta-D-heptose 7-phosphate kinase/D-beta-D-heptose 1-phosphate adenosyltransferase
MCKIYEDIHELQRELDRLGFDIYVTSGGFDPLHVGHLRCLQDGAYMAQKASDGVLVVIVNDDGFLERKKGYAFMPCDERMEIIAGIEGVDYVVSWNDESQTVVGALEILEPDYFLKGGDRDDRESVPEFDVCKDLDCKVVFNVGGGKVQSSSTLVERQRIAKNLSLGEKR